jgi:PAS domain S-box-containing protein
MYLSNLDGVFLKVNATFCRMMAYTEEELLAMKWTDLCHPDELAAALERRETFR